jgi:hypothetical protein
METVNENKRLRWGFFPRWGAYIDRTADVFGFRDAIT